MVLMSCGKSRQYTHLSGRCLIRCCCCFLAPSSLLTCTCSNIHYFFVASELCTILTPLEIFAGLFAGAVHDVQHPGVNNAFLCNTEHDIAITYNDTSPLENMHCATAFAIAKTSLLLEGVPEASRQMFRKIVVGMVLDTGA
jgi:cAMP-specific phosphodiesterase 4